MNILKTAVLAMMVNAMPLTVTAMAPLPPPPSVTNLVQMRYFIATNRIALLMRENAAIREELYQTREEKAHMAFLLKIMFACAASSLILVAASALIGMYWGLRNKLRQADAERVREPPPLYPVNIE